MMIKKERNLKAIKRANKGENLRQFAFCYSKLLENGLVWNHVKSIYNVYLGWASKVAWIPWTTTSQPPLNAHLNWYGYKWKANVSKNYKHKVLFINQYNVFFTIIKQMPPKGLVKAKSQLAPKARTTYP